MTIVGVRTANVSVPIPRRPVTVGGPTHCECVLVWVDADDGTNGQSCIWMMGQQNLDAYASAVHALEHQVVGQDESVAEEIGAALWHHLKFQFGTKGIGVTAASAIESACWDLLGKTNDQSISSMLGRKRDRVPVYVGASFWYEASITELQVEAETWLEDGFRALKMRAGVHGADEDVKRIAAVRDVIGPDIELMVDCLQRLSFDEALDLGRQVEDHGLAWIEDPLDCRDVRGHARLSETLETPIATGEHEYGVHGFEALLAQEAADIVLIDLARVGGVRDFVSVAELSAAHGVGVVSHCNPEQSLQVLAAAPEAIYVDQLTWWEPLYAETIEFDDGHYVIPDRPGFGFTFVDDVVERFGVESSAHP